MVEVLPGHTPWEFVDRGKEMAAHMQFTLATDIQVYFCDPKSPATRKQLEHQRLATSVPPEGHRHVGLLTSRAQRGRETIERKATQDAWLPNAG